MKKIIALLLSFAMVFCLAACGSKENAPASESTQPTTATTTTEAPAEAPAASTEEPSAPSEEPQAPELSGTMKIVATSESYQPLFEKFGQETGVSVELLSMSSGEVLSKLRSEGGTSSADLWFGGGIDAFMAAKEDGLLEQVNFAASEDLAPEFKDADNYYFSKGITIVGFLLNNKLMQELGLEAPESWDDLLDPQYENEIIMSNPAVSGTNYAVVNCLLQNKEDGWAYFDEFNKNVASYAKRGSDPKNKLIADEYAIAVTYIDGTIESLLNDYDVTIVYPTDGMPWVPEGVAAFANGENTEAAKYFIEWLFSSDENLKMLAEIDQKSAVKTVKPSMEGIELSYDPSLLMDIDLSLFGTQRDEILAQFETLMGDKVAEE